ncbi:BREX system ATP-binding domain-containing protein [Streptomyces sp. NPDC058964]|uniref:helix-turn-helix transcriptional regulator n=1 Tax=Streptomyces sp. NPDC058964 TaxID=3346681 RepID=UPI0036D19AFA
MTSAGPRPPAPSPPPARTTSAGPPSPPSDLRSAQRSPLHREAPAGHRAAAGASGVPGGRLPGRHLRPGSTSLKGGDPILAPTSAVPAKGRHMTQAGRASVAGALETVLATCAVGRSRVVVIEGAAGCGKSHLLDAVAERAIAAGALVLTATATEAGHRVPLGLLRQLVGSAPAFALPRTGAEDAGPTGEAMRTFCAELCDLALAGPVVLCLDDVHHADAQSLHHLRYLVRHVRPAPVLVVAAVSSYSEEQQPLFGTESTREPHFRRIRLGLLTRRETAEVADVTEVAEDTEVTATRTARTARTAVELHHITGGNPLLLRALLEEDRVATASPPSAPALDGPFAAAVASCLRRSGPNALATARAVAILADRATESLVNRMLRPDADGPATSPDATAAGPAALRACGLLDGVRFRHPSVPAAVLADTSPRLRADLHRRAALALAAAAAPADVVADHLLAPRAEGLRVPVRPEDFTLLMHTAEDLLARRPGGCRTEQAERLLELAHGICPDEAARTGVALRLAQIAARRDPEAAEQRLAALATGPRAHVAAAAEHRSRLAGMLLAQGRIAESAALLGARDDTTVESPVAVESPVDTPFDTLLDTRAADSETLLRSTRLTDDGLAQLVVAVRTLLYSDRPESAVPASGRLLEEAEAAGAPGWRAVFATLHAEALLRMGDVRGAHAHATAALEALPAGGGGSFRYGPVAVLVEACGALGRYAEAAGHTRLPVTRRVLNTLYGLQYLRARGLHQLDLGRARAALADFRRIGRTVQLWRADRPACLPWRTDAAQALLRLGRVRQARELTEEQLALPDARRPWVRGLSLRSLAAASEPDRRSVLLRQSVEQLRCGGARLETARALADLGHALHADGGPSQGAATLRAAWNLAQQMGAVALRDQMLPGSGGVVVHGVAAPESLTESERRVAALAAQGLTNRQIAARLYVTSSTVEQHLTRVYRKLGVPGRTGLPADLDRAPAGGVTVTG